MKKSRLTEMQFVFILRLERKAHWERVLQLMLVDRRDEAPRRRPTRTI